MCRGLVACLLGVFADKRPVACLRKNNRLVGKGQNCVPHGHYIAVSRVCHTLTSRVAHFLQMSDLNRIFWRMDDVVANHFHIYKVETVGSEYLCVAGVSTRCPYFLLFLLAYGPCLVPCSAPPLLYRDFIRNPINMVHAKRVARESRASQFSMPVPCAMLG
jgi:hypothetical protein